MAYVTGAAFAIHKSVREKIGLLDEMFHPIYYEEVDYCYRARAAGFRVVVATKSVAIHNESTSMNQLPDFKIKMLQRNRYRFILKHYSVTQFLADFVPAETEYLQQQPVVGEKEAIRLACLEMAILAPTILPPTTTPAEVTAVQNALLQLRQTAVMATARRANTPPALEEFTFPRTGSVVQALIGRFRSAWSSVAAKWLTRNLLQQQHLQNIYLQQQLDHLSLEAKSQAAEIEQLLSMLLPMQQEPPQRQSELAIAKPIRQMLLQNPQYKAQHTAARLFTETDQISFWQVASSPHHSYNSLFGKTAVLVVPSKPQAVFKNRSTIFLWFAHVLPEIN